jgi:hypothetical protein
MENLKINWTRINNDVNGNPRYVCHFMDLLTNSEQNNSVASLSIEGKYKIALIRAKKIGGRKFHNKQYGGGIVFQSYNLHDTEKSIFELLND